MLRKPIVGMAVAASLAVGGCGGTTKTVTVQASTTQTSATTTLQEDPECMNGKDRFNGSPCTPPSSASTETTSSTSAAPLGKAQTVGDLVIRPTAFTKLSANGQQTTWRVTITVKNNSSGSVDVFCGDDGASLMDDQGRTFDGKSVVNQDGSTNCGDNIQPGLSNGPYMMDFNTPNDAIPATLSLWGNSDYQDQAQDWSVH